MTVIQLLNVAFDVWSILFCLILVVGVVASRAYDRVQAGAILAMLFLNVLLNGFEIAAYCFRGDPSQLGFVLVRVSNFAVFLCNHLLVAALAVFVFRAIEKNGGHVSALFKRVVFSVVALGIVLLVLSRVFGFYYAFDEQNRYYRLGNYWIMLVLQMGVLVALAVVTIKNGRLLASLERFALMMFELLPFAAAGAQTLVYGISLTTFVNTISITLIFMAYQINYSRYMVARERSILDEVIDALAQAVDARDAYTSGHSRRVARYSVMIAERMGLDKERVHDVRSMAMLHDVGKIGVPDNILNKSSGLTDEEYEAIQSHAAVGDGILAGITSMPDLRVGARWHHERFDGGGYPDGLAGDDIPLEARIVCVADSYDAMTSNRVYRSYLPQEVVRREIEAHAGSQFDPAVACAMLCIIDEDAGYELHG